MAACFYSIIQHQFYIVTFEEIRISEMNFWIIRGAID